MPLDFSLQEGHGIPLHDMQLQTCLSVQPIASTGVSLRSLDVIVALE